MENIGKIQPYNIDAEKSCLGAMLLDNEAIGKAIESISEDSFYKEAHSRIYEGIVELYEKNEPVDLVTLTANLKNKKLLDLVGGASYISDIIDTVPTSANVDYYIKIIDEKALLRNLIKAANQIITHSYKQDFDINELVDNAERVIFKVAEKKISKGFFKIDDILHGSMEMIEGLYARKEQVTGVPTGFKDIDIMTAGLQPSDLIIVAGRPSMGKTSFALNVAQNISVHKKMPVAVFSIEMSKEQLALRMLCAEAKIDFHKVRTGFLSESDFGPLSAAAGRLAEAPIFIDDSPILSSLEIRAKARRLVSRIPLSLIIVDYLQMIVEPGSKDSRQQQITTISRSLKALARELRIPVIVISQLSRALERREDKRPQLSDLRESGAIEQDADLVLFIYREEVYKRASAEGADESIKGIAEIIIGKHRNGPTGIRKLVFQEKYTQFSNLEREHTEFSEEETQNL